MKIILRILLNKCMMWGNIINKVVQKNFMDYDITFMHFTQRQIAIMRSEKQIRVLVANLLLGKAKNQKFVPSHLCD
jgi:hypothetical protein